MKITPQTISSLPALAAKKKAENEKFFRQLSAKDSGRVDDAFQRQHEKVFGATDCLECGNCCKSLGPRLTGADIERMARALKMKPAVLFEKYLRQDEDQDYVFSTMPCPFIDAENYCAIYDDRPRACREYPHTDRRRMQQILDITLKNTATCPAVYAIVEELKKMKI